MTKHVLLVEDDIALGDVVEELLVETLDLRVSRAYTADEALGEIRRAPGRFDMVMSDIVMPGSMNGVDLARLVRQDYPTMPILLCTGNAPVQVLKTSEEFPLLRKPFRLNELRRILGQMKIGL